jgi:signal transduction histidine kinase
VAQAVPVRLQRRVARIAWPAIAVTATLICGAFASGAAHPNDLVAAAGDLAVAVVFVTCGAILWADDRTGDLSGPLMVATGAAWLLGDLADGLALLHRGPLVQLLVAAPGGRPRTWTERLVVAAGYADALVAGVWHNEGATVGLAVAVAVTAIGRWVRAGVAQRHARAVPAAAAVTITLVLVAGALAGAQHGDAVMWCYEAVLVLTAVALFVDARRRLVPQVVTKVVIDLGSTAGGSLTQALRRAVGDPSLVVGYVLDDGRVVDEAGRQVDLPAADAERSVTTIEADGTSAVLVHDRTALRAPGLADSVAAAVRLALDNVRLESEIRARVRDVEASRARLVATRDSERRSLETRLRAGVDDRLGRVAGLLEGLEHDPEALVSTLPSELGRARGALARFAAGLHPAGLEAGGLPVALRALAAGAPQQVEVDVACGRLPPDVELAAWFVCSEALANAIKHAAAARVTIRAELADGWLGLTVADDGPGGADPAAGRGLRGLAARVDVIGGRLELGERPGGGTRLRAWLPAREGT